MPAPETIARTHIDAQLSAAGWHVAPPGYNVCHLGAAGFDPVNQIVISTIQRLFAQPKGDPEAIDDGELSSFDSDLATGEPIEVSHQPNLPPPDPEPS